MDETQQPPRAYRGRRRAGLPRTRYAAVFTTAVVGAGIVALGVSTALPERHNDLSFEASSNFDDITTRAGAGDRAARSRTGAMSTVTMPAPDVWILPMQRYTLTSFYGERWGRLHPGVDLGAPQGTPFNAVAAGKVILCRWNGGYGYNVMIDHGGGIVTVYGHASKLLCKEGQLVKAGDPIALTGNTGHSFGAHLHFEVREHDRPVEPLAFMRKHGVDIQKHTEDIYR
ncbi:M23 family metallopeptidase [Dactylosporangium aurantiacum]|uniref:M23 family metallopeptidase n=1 Tax=Dactylosporangium aurantiacum TaxID=35754 RepID=UPI000524AF53|nr:M23 family metallopeptidase [Dactylosporangium aurantiacum]MDG6105383.1 M23 family metallopeptidase [Dactylosporangium aurantiacum]